METINELREIANTEMAWMEISPRDFVRMADEIEREIAEKYMELPVDADGMPIHVGDVLEYDYGDDVRGTRMVCALIYDGTRSKEFDGGIWDFEFDDDDEGDSRNVHCMSDFYECNRHVKPDPIKELLEKFAYEVCDLNVTVADLERYAAKIREVVSADE